MSILIDANNKSINENIKVEQNGNNKEIESKASSNSFKKNVVEHVPEKSLSAREIRSLYFKQYKNLNEISEEKDKKAIIQLLLDDLGSKNISMTEKERFAAVQKIQKFF